MEVLYHYWTSVKLKDWKELLVRWSCHSCTLVRRACSCTRSLEILQGTGWLVRLPDIHWNQCTFGLLRSYDFRFQRPFIHKRWDEVAAKDSRNGEAQVGTNAIFTTEVISGYNEPCTCASGLDEIFKLEIGYIPEVEFEDIVVGIFAKHRTIVPAGSGKTRACAYPVSDRVWKTTGARCT